MADFEDVLVVAEKLLRGRYGSWLNQPDEMALCTFDDSCDPMMWEAPYELRKLVMRFSRIDTAQSVPQDVALCTFHFLNLTGDEPDDTWITGDFTTIETAWDALWATLKAYYAPQTVLAGYQWYQDGPAFKPHGSTVAPLVRAVSRSVAGTEASSGKMLPPQAAVSVTEVTPAKFTVTNVEGDPGTHLRNRWGRFYLPAPSISTVATTGGRMTDAFASAVSSAVGLAYSTAAAADLVPVMYSPTTGSSWSVDSVHVDDIFDVIRKRRYDGPVSRHPTTI